MGVYINFVCDDCKQYVQNMLFDQVTETWQDMLNAIHEANWSLKLDGAKVEHASCPKCSGKVSLNQP